MHLTSPTSWFYGWYIALGGAVSAFFVLGVGLFGLAVFVPPMREELDWSAAALSAGASIRTFEQGFLAPISGLFIDRFGPRRIATAGVLFVVIGLLIFSQARTLQMYYASSFVLALGQTFAALSPFSARLMVWFVRKRGRAIGLLNTGNGMGYLAVPILAVLVSLIGWRSSLVVAAVAIAVVCLPLTVLLRDRPTDRGLTPDGATDLDGSERVSRLQGGMSVREAFRTPAFYLLTLATAAGGWQSAWILLQVDHLDSAGFSLGAAAAISGVYGILQPPLRVTTGWIGDTFGRKRIYAASFLVQGIGLLIFAQLTADRFWLLPFYFVTFAIGQATMIVLGQTMIADYFGPARFASIRGYASTLQTPIGIAAPLFAGIMFDRTGSYMIPFTVFGFVAFTGALWVMLIRRPMWADLPEETREATGATSAEPIPRPA